MAHTCLELLFLAPQRRSVAVVCQIEVVRDFHFEVVRKRGRFPRCHRKVGRGSEFTMIKWQRGLCPRPPQDFFEAWQQETTGGAHSHAFIVKAFPLCRRKAAMTLETGTGALVRKPLFFWFGPRGRFLVFWVSLGAGCLPAEPGLRFPKRQRDVASLNGMQVSSNFGRVRGARNRFRAANGAGAGRG